MYLAMALYGFAILIPAVFFAVAILLVKIWQKIRWIIKGDNFKDD